MERIERAVIRESFREARRTLGFSNQQDAWQALANKDKSISIEDAEKYVKGQYVGGLFFNKLSEAALSFLVGDHEKILNMYTARGDTKARDYVESIFSKYHSNEFRSRNIDAMANNWKIPYKKGRDAFSTGVYQIYRRYKPTTYELTRNPRAADPNEHAIICELLFADSETMECLLITCQRNVYHGFMYINREGILYGIVQRSNKENTGLHQRFFCLKLEVQLPMYSAIMVKTGDTMGKPISSECVYVGVQEDGHKALYKDIVNLATKPWQIPRVAKDSIIMDYISLPPDLPPGHDDWEHVKYVKDFPALALMAVENRSPIKALLREPSRTLSPDTIRGIAMEAELGVFRHSTFQQRKLAAADMERGVSSREKGRRASARPGRTSDEGDGRDEQRP